MPENFCEDTIESIVFEQCKDPEQEDEGRSLTQRKEKGPEVVVRS